MRRTRHDHPFVVEIGALRRSPGSRQRVEVSAPISELFVSGSRVPEDAEVHFRGLLESVHEGILVTGVVEAPWEGECRRCLEPARGSIETSLCELAVEHGDDETTYPLDPEELDLEQMLHDTVILELPLAPLCAEDCAGLCAECGANLNLEACSCERPVDSRWGPLVLLGGGGAEQATAASSPAGAGPGAAAAQATQAGRGGRRPASRPDTGRPRRA
jgi:uncharacterized protein